MVKINEVIKIGEEKFRCIITKAEINKKIRLIAKKICNNHKGKDPPIIVLTEIGGLNCGTELTQCLQDLNFMHEVDTVCIKSYVEDGKPGDPILINPPILNPVNRNLIIVEDIIDNGGTLNFLSSELKKRYGTSFNVEYLALIVKKDHKFEHNIDYYGWIGEFGWLIGNGMDTKIIINNHPYYVARGLRDIYEKI